MLVCRLQEGQEAVDFTGLVVSILDGDTIEVLHTERIRLPQSQRHHLRMGRRTFCRAILTHME